MTLRDKVVKLLEVQDLPVDERQVLDFVMSTAHPSLPLEDQMYPSTQAHVHARYEWYFRRDGQLRRVA